METIKLCEEDSLAFVQALEEDWGFQEDYETWRGKVSNFMKAVKLHKQIMKSEDDWLI